MECVFTVFTVRSNFDGHFAELTVLPLACIFSMHNVSVQLILRVANMKRIGAFTCVLVIHTQLSEFINLTINICRKP